jgi:Zn-dependent M32 family carboxypeptidase
MEMTKQDAELSPLARQLLGHSGVMKLFTQAEFNAALTEAKAEIMAIAIQTTRQAILIEREECAKLADECVNIEELGEAIRNRIPSQRQ